MGDRANIVAQYPGKKEVFFYTHWDGSKIKQTLARALERGKPRYDDSAYLARIIFSELIKDDVLGETGFGIALDIVDNEHPLLVVDFANKVVREESESRNTIEEWDFEEFVHEHI